MRWRRHVEDPGEVENHAATAILLVMNHTRNTVYMTGRSKIYCPYYYVEMSHIHVSGPRNRNARDLFPPCRQLESQRPILLILQPNVQIIRSQLSYKRNVIKLYGEYYTLYRNPSVAYVHLWYCLQSINISMLWHFQGTSQVIHPSGTISLKFNLTNIIKV